MSARRFIRAASVAAEFLAVVLPLGCGHETEPSPPISVSVLPNSATIRPGGTLGFTATVENDPADKGVTWTLTGSGCSGVACGTIAPTTSASGASVTYTAPGTVPSPATVAVTATSVADDTKLASATVTIGTIGVFLSPNSATVAVNGTHDFTATVDNDPANKGVTWTLAGTGCSGADCGTIAPTSSASGAAVTYTAPANVPSPPNVTVTATSVADKTKSASASIAITQPVSVNVTPAVAGVDVNTARNFTATVNNDPTNKGVDWTLTGSGCADAACGTIAPTSSPSGTPVTYTAPATVPNPAAVTLTATAAADNTQSGSATVIVTTPGVISVAVIPSSASIRTRTGSLTRQFTAYVFNDPSNAGVTWSVDKGSISPTSSASGVPVTYTAPRASGTALVTATSVADPTKSATATVHLLSSCPLVYSWDGTRWRLDSGTFGGAIVRALVKTDVDNLDFATPQDGLLRLRLADELAETDYVDELTVLAVDHDSGMTVAPDGAGTLYTVGSLTLPERARDFRGEDVLAQVSAADGWSWESNPVVRDTAMAADLRDGIELTFLRPAGAQAARLVVDGNNSPWAAAMMLAFVSAHGRATQAWYDSLDATPERTRRMFATLLREASLSVSVWATDRWEPQGAVWEVGPEVAKRQVVPLDLSRVEGDTVQVRLESVPNFWLVDQVTLDFSAARPFTVTELSPTTALDRRGRDVRDPLAVLDGRFFTMEPGDFAEVDYQMGDVPPGQARTFLLRSTGYYRIHSPEVGKPDMTLLKRVLTEPAAISRMSIARMNQALLAMQRREP